MSIALITMCKQTVHTWFLMSVLDILSKLEIYIFNDFSFLILNFWKVSHTQHVQSRTQYFFLKTLCSLRFPHPKELCYSLEM